MLWGRELLWLNQLWPEGRSHKANTAKSAPAFNEDCQVDGKWLWRRAYEHLKKNFKSFSPSNIPLFIMPSSRTPKSSTLAVIIFAFGLMPLSFSVVQLSCSKAPFWVDVMVACPTLRTINKPVTALEFQRLTWFKQGQLAQSGIFLYECAVSWAPLLYSHLAFSFGSKGKVAIILLWC